MNKCLERVNDRHFWNPGVFSYVMIPRWRPNSRVFSFIVTSISYGLPQDAERRFEREQKARRRVEARLEAVSRRSERRISVLEARVSSLQGKNAALRKQLFGVANAFEIVRTGVTEVSGQLHPDVTKSTTPDLTDSPRSSELQQMRSRPSGRFLY